MTISNADKARIIRKAMEIIATPETWCTGHYAKDANGDPTWHSDPEACRWCAAGAVRFAMTLAGIVPDDEPLFGTVPIRRINDNDGHAAVLAAMDARAKELEPMA